MRQRVWRQERPAEPRRGPNWLESLGALIFVGTVIGVADLVRWLVGGERLEIWVWRLFGVMALQAWLHRRMGWAE